jgi:hypothetical protein
VSEVEVSLRFRWDPAPVGARLNARALPGPYALTVSGTTVGEAKNEINLKGHGQRVVISSRNSSEVR